MARRLAEDREYQAARAEADRLRRELAELDARIEEAGRRHRSDANMAYLVASLLGAGLRDAAEAALAAYAAGCSAQEAEGAPAGAAPARAEEPAPAREEGDLAEGTFRILEVRPGKWEGKRSPLMSPGKIS